MFKIILFLTLAFTPFFCSRAQDSIGTSQKLKSVIRFEKQFLESSNSAYSDGKVFIDYNATTFRLSYIYASYYLTGEKISAFIGPEVGLIPSPNIF
jgi:hypothetical protein